MESSSFAQSIRMPRDSANGRPHVPSARSRGRLACASISGVTEMQRRGQLRRRRQQEEQVSAAAPLEGSCRAVPCRAALRAGHTSVRAKRLSLSHSRTHTHTHTNKCAALDFSDLLSSFNVCACVRSGIAQLSAAQLRSARSTSARPAARIRDASVAAAAIRVVFLDCSTFTAWPLSLLSMIRYVM